MGPDDEVQESGDSSLPTNPSDQIQEYEGRVEDAITGVMDQDDGEN